MVMQLKIVQVFVVAHLFRMNVVFAMDLVQYMSVVVTTYWKENVIVLEIF